MLETKIMTVNGIRLNVFDQGNGEPILLLHGFPDSLQIWRKVVPQLLSAGYRVIAYDQRGYGESELLDGVNSYKMKHIIGDCIALLDMLGLDKVYVAGHDWGSSVGWSLAMRQPERIKALVTISTGHHVALQNHGGFEQLQKRWYIFCFLEDNLPEKVFMDNDAAVFRLFCQDNPDLDTYCIPQMTRPGRFEAALNWYKANILRKEQADPNVALVQVPTFGIVSDRDNMMTADQMRHSGKYVAEGLWEFDVITECGHWIPIEQPEALTNRLLTFFSRYE